MTIRLFGTLLCGGLLVLVAPTNSFAQSGRNNTVQGNFIGTSRGIFVTPADTTGDGRSRSKAARTDGTVDIGAVENSRRQGFRIPDNQSPRPQDRKANRKTSSNPIFDRWGRTDGSNSDGNTKFKSRQRGSSSFPARHANPHTKGGGPSTYFVGTANGGVWRR